MRVSTALVFVPLAIVAAAIAVANRGDVLFRLDPFSDTHPALAYTLPLYLLLFLAFLIGVLAGVLVLLLRRPGRRKKNVTKQVSSEMVALDLKRPRGDSLDPS